MNKDDLLINISLNPYSRIVKDFYDMYKLDYSSNEFEITNINKVFDIKCESIRNKLLQTLLSYHFSNYKNTNKILIHCNLGQCRSTTLIIMYIMKKLNLNLDIVKIIYFII